MGFLLWQSEKAILFNRLKEYPTWRLIVQTVKTWRQLAFDRVRPMGWMRDRLEEFV